MTRLNSIRIYAERMFPEHVALEGEPSYYHESGKRPHRITRSRWSLTSRLHACSTELSLLEGHYMRVHTVRSRGRVLKYQFDLRYLNPRPVRVRHIAWAWLLACIASFAVAGVASTWVDGASIQAAAIAGVAAGGGCLALFFFLRRTTESLTFRSEHGQATLVEVTGGIGSTRQGKAFFVEMIKDINAAKTERPQAKEHFLCDEMREHHHLRGLGVLSDREYEQSKARILAQH